VPIQSLHQPLASSFLTQTTNHSSTMSRDMKDWGDYEDDEELPQAVEVSLVFVACEKRKGGWQNIERLRWR